MLTWYQIHMVLRDCGVCDLKTLTYSITQFVVYALTESGAWKRYPGAREKGDAGKVNRNTTNARG